MGLFRKSSQATTCPNQIEEVQLLKLTKPKAEVKANGEVQLLKLMPGNLTVPATRKTGKPEAKEAKRVLKKEVVMVMMAPPVWIPTVSLIPIGMKFVRTSMTCTCVKSSLEAFTHMVLRSLQLSSKGLWYLALKAMMLLLRPNRVLARLPPSPFPFCRRLTPS